MYVKVKPRDCINLISSGHYQGLAQRLLSEGLNLHKARLVDCDTGRLKGRLMVQSMSALIYLIYHRRKSESLNKYYSITSLRVVKCVTHTKQ